MPPAAPSKYARQFERLKTDCTIENRLRVRIAASMTPEKMLDKVTLPKHWLCLRAAPNEDSTDFACHYFGTKDVAALRAFLREKGDLLDGFLWIVSEDLKTELDLIQ